MQPHGHAALLASWMIQAITCVHVCVVSQVELMEFNASKSMRMLRQQQRSVGAA
jgi:hypothetical protein